MDNKFTSERFSIGKSSIYMIVCKSLIALHGHVIVAKYNSHTTVVSQPVRNTHIAIL